MSEAPTLVEAGRREAAGAAVARMYERHARSLYGLCRMLLRDAHEAEDALQATFLAAHGALLRGGGPRDEAAWLATIARNECRGRLRARMTRPLGASEAALAEHPDPGPGPDEQVRDPEIRRALQQLPQSQREAVVLHDVWGLKAREVGRALGLSVPAVEALLFRGRRQLCGRLRPVHGAHTLPVGLRDSLAHLIPGFATSDAAPVVAGGAGAVGLGLLAKLGAAPATVKVAAGVAAVATAGSVVAVESRREGRAPTAPAAESVDAGSTGSTRQASRGSGERSGSGENAGSDSGESGSGRSGGDDDRSGSGNGNDDGRSGRETEDDRDVRDDAAEGRVSSPDGGPGADDGDAERRDGSNGSRVGEGLVPSRDGDVERSDSSGSDSGGSGSSGSGSGHELEPGDDSGFGSGSGSDSDDD